MNKAIPLFLYALFLLFVVSCNKTTVKPSNIEPDIRGAVATVNPLATMAGEKALKQGGNAIDAALAAAFTLGVVDSHNSGIGGGCFILIRWADGRIEAIDGREMAPAAATRNMYLIDGKAQPELSKTGALAIGVPGSVAALEYLQKTGGKLSFADVLLPAAQLAEQGFAIDKIYSDRLERTQSRLQKFPASAEIFLNPNGQPWSSGHVLKQKDLANTYRALAEQGSDYFYRGEFAKAVADWMQDNDGIVTAEDFARYRIVQREPVVSRYENFEIYGFPPPSSGGVHVAQIINILQAFDLTSLSSSDRLHVLAEAMKLAFADRAYWLGDPDYVKVPKGLMREDYAQQLAKNIDINKAGSVPGPGQPPLSDKDLFSKHTTHIAAADSEGNWVAITTTLNTSFGSKVTIPGTGVLMNNQMDDFSIQPGVPNAFGLVGAEANSVQAGKRPLSSMSPTIVLRDGQPILTVGAAGGPTIITQVLQALVNHLVLGMPIDEAVAATRVHHQWKPNYLWVEQSLSSEQRQDLERKGHVLKNLGPFGATQAIAYDGREFSAVIEPRLKQRNRE